MLKQNEMELLSKTNTIFQLNKEIKILKEKNKEKDQTIKDIDAKKR